MGAFWWVIVGVAAAPILWFGVKVVVGYVAPPEFAAKRLLMTELVKCGVSPIQIGQECIADLTHGAVVFCQDMHAVAKKPFRPYLVEQIEFVARLVASYLRGSPPISPEEPHYRILKRHNVVG